jgi:hypothetical protein
MRMPLGETCGAAAAPATPPTTTAAPPPAAPATARPTAEPPKAPMPDVVCKNLQIAQETIQAAGVFFSESDDSSGANRSQTRILQPGS